MPERTAAQVHDGEYMHPLWERFGIRGVPPRAFAAAVESAAARGSKKAVAEWMVGRKTQKIPTNEPARTSLAKNHGAAWGLRRLRGGRPDRAARHRPRETAVRRRARNVQPHAGAQTNMAVYMAALQTGDTILSLRLDHGGHLTHGLKVNFSGRLYTIAHYGVSRDTNMVDYDEVLALAKQHLPN